MSEILPVVGFLSVWGVLQLWLLPRLGVAT